MQATQPIFSQSALWKPALCSRETIEDEGISTDVGSPVYVLRKRSFASPPVLPKLEKLAFAHIMLAEGDRSGLL